MLELAIIKPSTSPWASPVPSVPKKDRGIRLCINYHRLNTVTLEDLYQMPRINELLDKLGKTRYLTMLDLTKRYYQVPKEEEDRAKTTIVLMFGKYQFITMPFRL